MSTAFPRPAASKELQGPAITGTVYDSLTQAPLEGAQVQLVPTGAGADGARRAAMSDSAGRFTIRDVPHGTYAIGFFHPRLDSLGLESVPQPLTVADGITQRVALATPSPATLRRAICPEAGSGGDSTALVLGRVHRTGQGTPLAEATVTTSWTEFYSAARELGAWSRREQQVTARTTADGWFALCGVPAEVPVLLRAAHGADSSGFVRVTLPAGGLRHVAWQVGGATAMAPDSAGGSGASVVWRGQARLTGRVRDATGRPVAGAQVTVWGTGLDGTADPRGTFALDRLPGGTQTLEVRAIGYLPVTKVVQLASGQGTDVDVALTERVTELPKVAVTERADRTLNIRLDQFYQRMRDVEKGINRGYFFTPEAIEKRNPPLISNLLDGIPGLVVQRDAFNRFANVVRGPLRIHPTEVGDRTRCIMTVFLDGQRIENPFDSIVLPNHVAAVEVYPHPVSAPPQYQPLNGTCGVILIWTK